jgi:hypothetical protein|nr:GIY-YIG nuclease family protein [uncultured Steroidobacter sp.]
MGRTIRIFLADGDVAGIRHAEIVNWTGQALAFSRNNIAELKNWSEIRKQGVYFLLGVDGVSGRDAVYIGEAEVVTERLPEHMATKDFWSECIAFTSKDDNLTKAHIKYLESALVHGAKAARRYLVLNSVTPQQPALPRADRDAMDEFAGNIRTLLGVLGHRVLDPILASQVAREAVSASDIASGGAPAAGARNEGGDQFQLRTGAIVASAVRTTDAFVVLKGSRATKDEAFSLSRGNSTVRAKLISAGVLLDVGEQFEFSENYAFPSPSQAASVIVGYSANGRLLWKDNDGRSLADVEDDEARAFIASLIEGEQVLRR